MKYLIPIILLVILVAVLTACAAVVDTEGFKVGNPESFAQATHIARLSQEAVEATRQAVAFEATRQAASIKAEATRSAIQAQSQQAGADEQTAKAKVVQDTVQAQVAGKSAAYALGYAGLGAGVLVLPAMDGHDIAALMKAA